MVSTSGYNNGISDYIESRNDSTYKNIITVAYSGSVGTTFYHKQKVFVGETVVALIPKIEISEYVARFICTILKVINSKYSYDNKIKVSRYSEEIIYLPITITGELNIRYMEDKIKEIESKNKEKFYLLNKD